MGSAELWTALVETLCSQGQLDVQTLENSCHDDPAVIEETLDFLAENEYIYAEEGVYRISEKGEQLLDIS